MQILARSSVCTERSKSFQNYDTNWPLDNTRCRKCMCSIPHVTTTAMVHSFTLHMFDILRYWVYILKQNCSSLTQNNDVYRGGINTLPCTDTQGNMFTKSDPENCLPLIHCHYVWTQSLCYEGFLEISVQSVAGLPISYSKNLTKWVIYANQIRINQTLSWFQLTWIRPDSTQILATPPTRRHQPMSEAKNKRLPASSLRLWVFKGRCHLASPTQLPNMSASWPWGSLPWKQRNIV